MRRSLLAGSVLLAGVLPLAAQGLDKGLSQLDQLRRGPKTDFTQLERRAEKLLEQYKDPASQGRIYYQVAHVYAQTGLIHPQKVIDFAQKALKCPLDEQLRARLRVYCGDAQRIADRN